MRAAPISQRSRAQSQNAPQLGGSSHHRASQIQPVPEDHPNKVSPSTLASISSMDSESHIGPEGNPSRFNQNQIRSSRPPLSRHTVLVVGPSRSQFGADERTALPANRVSLSRPVLWQNPNLAQNEPGPASDVTGLALTKDRSNGASRAVQIRQLCDCELFALGVKHPSINADQTN